MAKGNAIVMYLEQARIHGEPIGVTRSEVLFTKPNGYTVQPHNRGGIESRQQDDGRVVFERAHLCARC